MEFTILIFSFFTYNHYHELFFFFIFRIGEERKIECKMNNVGVIIHGYCSKYVNLHNYTVTDVSHFYYTLTMVFKHFSRLIVCPRFSM